MTKQLQPIYDKPMIYYPLSLLMMMGLKEILIISTPVDTPNIKNLLGNGRELGIQIHYVVQEKPEGIAQAYTLGKEFLDGDDSMMVLGDNLFYGNYEYFRKAVKKQINKLDNYKARVFAYPVQDPERFGVVEFEPTTGKVISLEEKPKSPKSNYAVPGLYIFDGSACEKVENQQPSDRGELEITDLNLSYLREGSLACEIIGRGMAWLDTGTPESLLEASNFVHIIEKRQGLKIACVEEIAVRQGFINIFEYEELIKSKPNSPYREYLVSVLSELSEKDAHKKAA